MSCARRHCASLSMQLLTFPRRGFPGSRKLNNHSYDHYHRYATWFVSLPGVKEAPPRECKQLHAVELVLLKCFSPKNCVLRCCVALG